MLKAKVVKPIKIIRDLILEEVAYIRDSQNRLSGITYGDVSPPPFLPAVPDNVMGFSYDDFGNRIKKEVNGEASYYVNNELSVLNELNGAGSVERGQHGGKVLHLAL